MGNSGLVAAIAAGGALGAVSRHFVGGWVLHRLGADFPYGILFCNVLGSLLMGILVAFVIEYHGFGGAVRGFLIVGLLGGFTTFSSFSLDTLVLLQRGEVGSALLYVGASVLVAIGACLAGYHGMRALLP
ncbi:MAG: fluoride efflux transporter CrcB [Rhodospirillaceae bacterium]|nr:fluoride efflux transporter CrcB [Rhodospirillaceae bacterium]|tara:strand:- start:705 stop:1094 length:390 start_codon:yes stop_codon:yes gene_type:complete